MVNKIMMDIGAWLEIQKGEQETLSKDLDDEKKSRRKREFMLLIICLIAVIYSYPAKGFDENPVIEIPAISLKIPLRDAIVIFPTIIAALYLVYLSSALRHSQLMKRLMDVKASLYEFKRTGQIPKDDDQINLPRSLQLHYFLVPSPLHNDPEMSVIAAAANGLVSIFVGFVFVLTPYFSAIFITLKSWHFLKNKWVLYWDIFCVFIMILTLLAGIASKFPRKINN